MKRLSENDLSGAFPVFLLEITWMANVYRFSTFPCSIQKNDGTTLYFEGGLEDPELEESIADLDKNPEKNSLPLELIFPINLVEEYFKYGRSLDAGKGELSFVTIKNGQILQTYENRIRWFSGEIIQPIIGDPTKPIGYAVFSIERNPNNSPSPIIEANGIFQENSSFPASISLEGLSTGKAYPIVFGDGHEFIPSSGFSSFGMQKVYPTPGFIIYMVATATSVPNVQDYYKFWVVVAAHRVAATHVTIRDYQNNSIVKPVQFWVDDNGKEISYVELQYATHPFVIVDGIVNPYMYAGPNHGTARTTTPKYYISWTHGGGMLNPYGDGFLEGAGDLILYFLSLSNSDVDLPAWRNVANFLNGYKFAGYIDDPQINPWDFLQDNIFPYIPIQATNGANGIKPVIPLLYANQTPVSIYNIQINNGFYIVSALDWATEPDDIVNRALLSYGYCTLRENSPGEITIDGNLLSNQHNEVKTSTSISVLSYSKYGDRYEELEASYIYDYSTATKSLQYFISKYALPKIEIEIQADTKYGFLMLGDVLSLNSEEYFMENWKAQIIEKSWNNGSWNFKLELENNIEKNRRKK